GRAILAAPMRLEVRRGGKVLPVKAKLKFAETKPHRVVAESAWSAGPLNGRTTTEFDYDGAAKVTLDLAPTGGEVVDALDLVIPLKDVEAPLMHVCADGLRFNYGGIVPAGEGTVWTSKAASRGNLIGTFVPYVFVGGEERGLVWFASNDADWVVDVSERTPALALERRGGALVLRVRLIQKPAALKRPRKIIFGLQATPAKPMPSDPDWRTWGWGYTAKGGFNIVLLGMVPYWGGDYYGVFPKERDFEVVRRIAQTIKEGKDNKEFFDRYVAKYPEKKAEILWSSRSRDKDAIIPYTNLRGAVLDTPEWRVYQDEWLHYDYQPDQRSPRPGWQGTDFHVIPTRSRQDFLLYYYREFLRNGFDGIYWDNINIYANMNPDFGRGYVREDGQFQPDTDIWELRQLARRTAVMFHQLGKRNLTMPHTTNAYLVPVFSWATMNFDWEWRYGLSDFQDRFPRDYTRAATIGRQAGTVPVILGGIKGLPWNSPKARRPERTRTAVCIVHELNVHQGDEHFWKVRKRLFDLGYGTPGCKVHHYWDDKPVAKVAGLDAEFIVFAGAREVALFLADYGDGGDGTVTLDTRRLGLPADFAAVNWEDPSEKLTAAGGRIPIRKLKKHDFRLLIIPKHPPAPRPGLPTPRRPSNG
ncbi:MAG TPA: hypothetical protein VMZ50_03575, partial [Phycisphaerae bacterium]|nr:hypothetical protein [Phycisphaerae bacterium]